MPLLSYWKQFETKVHKAATFLAHAWHLKRIYMNSEMAERRKNTKVWCKNNNNMTLCLNQDCFSYKLQSCCNCSVRLQPTLTQTWNSCTNRWKTVWNYIRITAFHLTFALKFISSITWEFAKPQDPHQHPHPSIYTVYLYILHLLSPPCITNFTKCRWQFFDKPFSVLR